MIHKAVVTKVLLGAPLLQEMYVKRKSFAFNSDRPGAGGEEQREVFESAMKTVDVTFQNLDSSEISLTDGEGL